MDKTILTDKSINLLVALRKGQPEHYAEEDRENIERGLELLLASMSRQAQAGPVAYEVKGE